MQDQLIALCACGCGQPAPIAPHTNRSKGWVGGEPLTYKKGHHTRRRDVTSPYVKEDRGYLTPCWIWQLAIAASTGYGLTKLNGRTYPAHYRYWVQDGNAPVRGMHLDHLCRVRACVNPDHLELVTCAENMRRGAGTKLTTTDVSRIREELRWGTEPRVLAERFDVTRTTINDIRARRTWKEIP